MIRGVSLLLLVYLLALPAFASGPGGVRRQIESSMLVTGTIDIAPDGRVDAYRLKHMDALPAGVLALIAKNVPHWRFEPAAVGGEGEALRTRVSMRLVARKLDDGDYQVEIRSASFGFEAPEPGTVVAAKSMEPPRFPLEVARAGVEGTVYLLLSIGRQGTVEDAIAEQVNLRIVASEAVMDRFRNSLARAALRTAKSWTFVPPAHGESADEASWTARVPVDFLLNDTQPTGPGEWATYVPGPLHPSLAEAGDDPYSGPDSLAAGGVYQVGIGPRLLTPLTQR